MQFCREGGPNWKQINSSTAPAPRRQGVLMKLSIPLPCFALETGWEIPEGTRLPRWAKGHRTLFVLPSLLCIWILIHFASALLLPPRLHCNPLSIISSSHKVNQQEHEHTPPSWASPPTDPAYFFILNEEAKYHLNTWSNKDYNGEKCYTSLRSKCGDEYAAQGGIWERTLHMW